MKFFDSSKYANKDDKEWELSWISYKTWFDKTVSEKGKNGSKYKNEDSVEYLCVDK